MSGHSKGGCAKTGRARERYRPEAQMELTYISATVGRIQVCNNGPLPASRNDGGVPIRLRNYGSSREGGVGVQSPVPRLNFRKACQRKTSASRLHGVGLHCQRR